MVTDLGWLNNVVINEDAVKYQVYNVVSTVELTGEYLAAWLLRAITCIDLTTLAGDDTLCNVSRLCFKAARPISEDILNEMGFKYDQDSVIHNAAVCVYSSRVGDAVRTLQKMNMLDKINVASGKTNSFLFNHNISSYNKYLYKVDLYLGYFA